MKAAFLILCLLAVSSETSWAAKGKVLASARLDLDGDGQKDLVRVVDYGREFNKVEIFYTSGKPAETYAKLLPGSTPQEPRQPYPDSHTPSLEVSADQKLVIKDDLDGDYHLYGTTEITVVSRNGNLMVEKSSTFTGHHGGDVEDGKGEDYEFVKNTANAYEYNRAVGEELDWKKDKVLSPSCHPTLGEWNPENVPACAEIPRDGNPNK